ncbi:MAG: HigA family addiction module antidote protein [Nitrospira sp. SB0667_bin_9]|nr:HigA family addiction module antidote protein [Nitrospira sp. SB0667_bin_9]MYD32190.1 HigA family addiction module antidote protein [Nitrospira sp. SB0661_bin_20]MYJ23148.1 HigA family addiction module antidote protein [Nitrospira sp. SB0673_bin_12]
MGLNHPPHPGRSIRQDCLEAFGLTVTDGAKILGITRHMLSRILNGQAGISPEMAVRLEKAFGGTAQSWLALQQAYDLAQVERRKIKVRPASSFLEEARV